VQETVKTTVFTVSRTKLWNQKTK